MLVGVNRSSLTNWHRRWIIGSDVGVEQLKGWKVPLDQSEWSIRSDEDQSDSLQLMRGQKPILMCRKGFEKQNRRFFCFSSYVQYSTAMYEYSL